MSRSPLPLRTSSIVLLALGLSWILWSQTQDRRPDLITRITPNLFVIQGHGGNVAVLPSDAGTLLVDDMYRQDGPAITQLVQGITKSPIKYVINTHHHGDHTGSNQLFAEQNAEIIMHDNARSHMPKSNSPALGRWTYSDKASLFLGDHSVKILYFGPGHTDGDSVIYFPQERALHTGDLFVTDGEIFVDTANGGNLAAWDQTVKEALRLDFDVVIPGHGNVAKKEDLERWVHTIDALRDRIRATCPGGGQAGSPLSVSDLGLKTIWLERSMPALCQQLSK